MKIIQTGTTYKVYGEDLVVLNNLPAQTYKVGFGQFTGFFLEKQNNLEIKEDKIYGVHEGKANKVLNRFEKSRKNLGVILSGDKGIGKSLFARVLSNKAIANNIPVILVDSYISGLEDFLNSIESEVLVLFDEFDKTFTKKDGVDPQESMLSLFDGTSSGKKLFVITCNRYSSLNEYLINRPGRFHFHFRFKYPTAEEVEMYLKDKLEKEYYGEIHKVVSFSRKRKLNYDCLSAIVLELNEGELFEDAIRDLNIIDDNDSTRYNIKVFTKEGITFSTNNEILSLFGNETNEFWADDNNSNDLKFSFAANDIILDEARNVFIIPGDKLKVVGYECYSDVKEKYKNLHIEGAQLSINYGSDIHYNFLV